MLTEFYIEALLVNEDLADQVWELLDRGVIDDELAVRVSALPPEPDIGLE